jgi:TIR domain-containing protein
MSDIFISYKREDQAEAKALAESLKQVGWTVWWDPQLRAGERFDEVIERELTNARCVIVIWSRRAIQSQYVKDEATYALGLNKLIPVAIDEVSPPFRFQGLHTISLAGWRGSASASAFQKLRVDIERIIGPPLSNDQPADSAKGDTPRQIRPEGPAPGAPIQPTQPDADEDEDGSLSTFGFTATYGRGFKETQVPDIYSFRVYVNMLGRASDADYQARKEIKEFMKSKGYSSYEIINRRHSFFLGYYEYTVRFKRE